MKRTPKDIFDETQWYKTSFELESASKLILDELNKRIAKTAYSGHIDPSFR